MGTAWGGGLAQLCLGIIPMCGPRRTLAGAEPPADCNLHAKTVLHSGREKLTLIQIREVA